MTQASYIDVNAITLNSNIRFNYGEKVRQGRVEKFTKHGFTLDLTIDGDDVFKEPGVQFKTFNYERITSPILLLPTDDA